MTVAAHQNFSALPDTAAYSCQNAAGASVYQIIRLIRSVLPGCPLHRLLQYPLRVVEIIKTINLCNINQKWIHKSTKGALPCCHAFVPRHMKGINTGSFICFQTVDQQFFFSHRTALSLLRTTNLVMQSFNCFRLRTTSVL